MTATKPLDMPLPYVLKQEKDEMISEDEDTEDNEDDGDDDDDTDSVSSLLQPSIIGQKNSLCDDSEDEFLRLNTMVRRVYFSYLHKSIISNYNVCCQEREMSKADLKKFASHLELHAVRASLEASLYRQAMLKMISDVKNSTSHHKIHKKLAFFLDTPSSTVDVSVQTSDDLLPVVENISCEETPKVTATTQTKEETKTLDERISELLALRAANIEDKKNRNFRNSQDRLQQDLKKIKSEPDEKPDITLEKNIVCTKIDAGGEKPEKIDVNKSMEEIFGETSGVAEQNQIKTEDDNSKDSLMQHLEDMFCESEDSNDLTSLIEKHSTTPKSKNIDTEISEFCQEASLNLIPDSSPTKVTKVIQTTPTSTFNQDNSINKRKLTINSYKNMKKRALEGKEEDKQTRKSRNIWFVERIHQVAKLREKMLELSITNYRKHGRIKEKFIQLFGDSDGEEMMPDSPIHIEEHLTACKERIAPWVVRYLMPFYSNKTIQNRLLFKAVAKHIADMLIIENTFPEEQCVNQYIKDYFRDKTCIKMESDIYI